MASPVADFYSAPSGVQVYGGRFPPTMSGGATLDDLTASGAFGTLVTNLSGSALLGDATTSGTMSGPPAWFTSLSLLTWTQIGSNTIQDVNPAQDAAINPSGGGTDSAPWTPTGVLSGMTNQWSGGAYDQSIDQMWVGGGGHAGYMGNECYSIDLRQDSPAWVRRGYPSGSIQKPNPGGFAADGANSSLLPDGRPHAVHNYNLLTTDNAGSLVLMARGYQWNGVSTNFGYRFLGSTNDWDTSNPYAGIGSSSTGSCCYDPVRGVVWYMSGTVIASVNVTTGVVTTTSISTSGNVDAYYSHMEYDTTRNLVIIFLGGTAGGSWASSSVVFFDPSNPVALFDAPQSVATFQWGPRGIVYDAVSDRYLVWNTGASLTVITPPASSPSTNNWVHSTLTPSGTPSAPSLNGTWGRFRLSQKYGCAFLLNLTTEKLWALKLH
jgi:hypothetical protein